MQPAVVELEKLGPMPSSDKAINENLDNLVDHYAALIESIHKPINDDEARVLVKLFGPDECFGVAWSLLHLVESAPGWPVLDCLEDVGNEWIRRLRERAIRGGKLPSQEQA
jgi:hypothetical protein